MDSLETNHRTVDLQAWSETISLPLHTGNKHQQLIPSGGTAGALCDAEILVARADARRRLGLPGSLKYSRGPLACGKSPNRRNQDELVNDS